MKSGQTESNVPEEPRLDLNRLAQRTISGLGWTVGSQVLGQGSRFLISVVLARLLTPSDFGLLGMVVVFTGFASLFSDCGFGSALIQRAKVDERHFSSVFWLNLLFGVTLGGITVAASPIISIVFHEPRLRYIMMLIALDFPLSALSLVPRALISRAMDFRSLGLLEIVTGVISGVVAVVLAFSGFGVWSLVWQLLAYSALMAVGAWWVTGWWPLLLYDKVSILELFGFSSNLLGFTIVNYWYRNGDNLIVGKYFGSAALGVYAKAYNLMLLPLSQITWVVSKVMFPSLSRMRNDKARVRSIYLRSISIIALVTFPLMLGLLVIADHFILAVYGLAWTGVIPILRVFCILGMVQSVYSTVGWIYQSQGRTDWMFWWGIASASVSIAGMIIGVWLGSAVAIAACLTIVGILLLPYGFGIPGKLIGLSVWDVARSVSGVSACAATMAGLVWVLGASLQLGWPQWAYLGIEVPFGIALYVLLIHAFQLAPYLEFRRILARQVSAMFGASIVSIALRN